MNDKNRGTGRTSRIIMGAPAGAWMLVTDGQRELMQQALIDNERPDMTVVTVSDVLQRERIRGRNIAAAVKDHTIRNSRRQHFEAWGQLKSRVRPGSDYVASRDEAHNFEDEKREAQRRATAEVNKRLEKPLINSRWRHRSTGNEYRVESISQGSGLLHGHFVVHYRRTNIDSVLFSRVLLEWADKMERVS